jgi:hypothetical protein
MILCSTETTVLTVVGSEATAATWGEMWRHSGDLLGRLGRAAELLVDVKIEVELRDRTDMAWTTATFRRVSGKEEGLEATETTWVVEELEETVLAPWTGWQTPVWLAWSRSHSTSATSGRDNTLSTAASRRATGHGNRVS